jgi:4,5-DOPA dioxygenase extradiol
MKMTFEPRPADQPPANPSMPVVFVSHGSPMLVFEDIPARQFMAGLGQALPRPQAILCVSAHWETAAPAVSGAARPETIHDFYGFPRELYQLQYPAPGAPDLAAQVRDTLNAAGIACAIDAGQGLDHGAWNPLSLIYPQADIPVAQFAIQPDLGPAHHLKLGQALAPLRRQGVLILASGGAVHNLGQFRIDRERAADWALSFDGWVREKITAGEADALVDYRRTRPDGAKAHPTDEHFMPLFVALGAGLESGAGRTLHQSFAHGSLSMAAYVWEDRRAGLIAA